VSGRGPLPKPPGARARRNRKAGEATLTVIEDLDPPTLPNDVPWHPETLSWWLAIWASPAASQWDDGDTAGLLRLARLVDAYSSATAADQLARLSAEIRLVEERFGLSPAGRARLRWTTAKSGPTKLEQEPRASDEPESDPRLLLGRQGWLGTNC
jgi:hypothetical protein